MTHIGQNTQAPNFLLLNQNNQTVELTSLRGQWVLLYFYPKAMTPGCTTQACGLRDNLTQFLSLGIQVVGVSPDLPERLKKFEQKESLNFTLLSDPDCSVAKAYGAFGTKQFMGKTYDGILRSSFLIDPQGVVRHSLTEVKTASHHVDVLQLMSGDSYQ
jgi:thioredoxin-dependent peroxiredoxin